MDNPNRSLLQMNFEISANCKIRQKLLTLAMMRDKSANPSLSSRSYKREASYRSLSRDRLTTQSPQPTKSNKNLKNFIMKLFQSLSANKVFTAALENFFKSVNFDLCFEHRQKVLLLEQELKCLKSGQSFTQQVKVLIEELAVLFGIVSTSQVKNVKKNEEREKKIFENLGWFNIGRVKNMPISASDADLFRAILVIAGKDCEKKNAVEVFKALCANPGLGVKTLRGIVDLVKRGLVDKGKEYLDVVEKAYFYYQMTPKYTDNDSICKLTLIIEEFALLFNVYPKLNLVGGIKMKKKVTPKKVPDSPKSKAPKAVPFQLLNTQAPFNEHQINQSSKALLLKSFYNKSRREKLMQDDYQSDNTDFSETESRKKAQKSSKIEKMLLESRLYKRIESCIELFFSRKMAEEINEIQGFLGSREYSTMKMEVIKGKSTDWVGECLKFVGSCEAIGDGLEHMQDLTKSAILSKINDIIEKIKIDLEIEVKID